MSGAVEEQQPVSLKESSAPKLAAAPPEAAPPKEAVKKAAEPPAKMSQEVAFSAVRNPANPDRVFIYRIAATHNTLCYDQRAINKGIAAPRWNKSAKERDGVPSTLLRGDSNVVTLVFDDVVHIYGVVAGSCYVSLLSPFTEPVLPMVRASQGKLAGCSYTEHDEEQAWLVHQGYDGPGDDKKPQLFYSDVTSPETKGSPSSAKDILDATSLSLFHDTKRFWVIYQSKDGQLVAYNEKDQKPSVISSDKSHFLNKTPIASCFIPAKDIDNSRVPGFRNDALGRVIVYWVRLFNDKHCIYRAHADLTEKSSSADFSEPRQATENGVAVQKYAQIGVVANPDCQSNYLFVAKDGTDTISSVSDDWAVKNESLSGIDLVSHDLFRKWQAKILEEAILGNRHGHMNGHNGFIDDHHGHRHSEYTNGYTNGAKLIEEEFIRGLGGRILEEETIGRIGNGTKDMPLVWRNKGDTSKPQLHSGVITRTASSKWSEAEVQVVIPAGSTIMGDITVNLKVRPTD